MSTLTVRICSKFTFSNFTFSYGAFIRDLFNSYFRYLAHKLDLITKEYRLVMIIHLLRGKYFEQKEEDSFCRLFLWS